VIAVNRRFILNGMRIASSKSPILPIHSPDGDTILQTSQLTHETKLTLNLKAKLILEHVTNPTKP